MGEIAINPIHNVHKKYRTMNFVNPYIFAPPVDLSTNTEIGGVASTISTPALLATKLAIDVSRITNFSVVGSDIKCKIIGSYVIPGSAFSAFSGFPNILTFYNDIENIVTSLSDCFFGQTNIKIFSFKNVTSIGDVHTFYNTQADVYYLPNCIDYGDASVNNNHFFGIKTNKKIYAHPSMATINSGGLEADLAYAISQGATVRYVTNFDLPNPVTTLSAGTVYNAAIQLNFTAPIGSTNTIDYYECYANGVFKNTITASGGYVYGLTASTSYNLTVYAVDIFYNKSLVSNTLTQTTSSTNAIASETTSFESRIVTDGGVLIDKTYINEEYIKLIYNGTQSNLIFWYNYKSGIKKDVSNLVEKLYSFLGSNTDIIQITTANKPVYTTSGITFDTTDEMAKTLSTSIVSPSFTVMFKSKSTPGNYYPLIAFQSWDAFTFHSASGGNIYAGNNVSARFSLAAGSFLNNVSATYTFTYNSTTKIAKIYRDTTVLGSMTQTDPIARTQIIMNAKAGTFYDAKMFNKDLSLEEITAII